MVDLFSFLTPPGVLRFGLRVLGSALMFLNMQSKNTAAKTRIADFDFFRRSRIGAALTAALFLWTADSLAFQVRHSGDTYTSARSPGSNFGNALSLNVDSSPLQKSFIQFDFSDLSSAGFLGDDIDRAYLKLYVRTINTPGTFDVVRVTGPWNENTSPTIRRLRFSVKPSRPSME